MLYEERTILSAPTKINAAAIETTETVYKETRRDWLFLGLLLVLVEASIIAWTASDHSLPCWDTSNHRITSILAYDLLRHPHGHTLDWYRSLICVSTLYPPFFYIVSAGLKLILGRAAQTDLSANLGFAAVMFLSTYYAARETYKSTLAARFAVLILFLCPMIFWSTHCALLDCAANSMVALSLASFIWWAKKPIYLRSIVLGIVFGLTILTKNNAVIFLAGPVLIVTISALLAKQYGRISQLCLAGLVSGIVVLPWLLLAGPGMCKVIAFVQSQNLSPGDTDNQISACFHNLATFITLDIPFGVVTPLLCVCLVTALLSYRTFNGNKLYLLASAVCGVVLASSFRWQHQYRYITPAAIPLAIITAELFANCWLARIWWQRCLLVFVISLAVLQFLYTSFSQYPLRMPSWLYRVAENLFNPGRSKLTNCQGISLRPLPPADWGTLWSLSVIEQGIGRNATSVMIMPASDTVEISTFLYLAFVRGDPIQFLTCRKYAVLGDRVKFDPNYAASADWYVLKTGDQGRQMIDVESDRAYARWCNFVRSSKSFHLIGTKVLPDRSLLQIYHKSPAG
jgi:4-amino-4-deoxy-L-arabinose transferase-like glycosyltransferase